MKRNQKRLVKILISAIFTLFIVLLKPEHQWLELILYIGVYLIIGGDIVKKAVTNIFRGEVFDENFLMSIATIGAFFVGEYVEGVAVMLFYQVGELFQSYAVDQSRKSISSLMDIRPDYANLLIDGVPKRVDPDEVEINDQILVKPGERIPVDGTVLHGNSMLDTSALTGESVPRDAQIGDAVLSGCININGVLTIQVTKEFGDSTVNKILDLVENASNKKSQSENFITKFARYYTPIVVVTAIALAVFSPLIVPAMSYEESIYRALTFLVISCPCALVISVPLSFFGGIGGASKLGILIKGSNYLESLAKTGIVVFDKTGTLTKGVFKVQTIYSEAFGKEELLKYAAYIESYSSHPISLSLKEAYGKKIDESQVSNLEEISGHGVKGNVEEHLVIAGNEKLMQAEDIPFVKVKEVGTIVHLAVDGSYAGYIVIADEIKEDALNSIQELKKLNIDQTVMLTGDNQAVGEKVGKELGLNQVYTQLLPVDKVVQVEKLLDHKPAEKKLAFVGDGINDAPVLARADIGIAMGGLGSDAAIEAADVVIMTDEPSKIPMAIRLSKKTLGIVKQNIVFAISIKVLFLLLGALGLVHMGGAVFADVGVTVLAILNAIRCLRVKEFTSTFPKQNIGKTISSIAK